ncbi:MAG: hypothetical protein ACFCVF_14230 [Kineosporiaceae bacterium]
MPRAILGQLVLLLVLLAFYVLTLGWRGVALLVEGGPALRAIGAAILVVGAIGVWVTVQELRFGAGTARLGRALGAEGGLPIDDLPRTPAGRIDRAAADAAFTRSAEETRQQPADWRAWYRLALAYDAAGDRKRARAAARAALRLERQGTASG